MLLLSFIFILNLTLTLDGINVDENIGMTGFPTPFGTAALTIQLTLLLNCKLKYQLVGGQSSFCPLTVR